MDITTSNHDEARQLAEFIARFPKHDFKLKAELPNELAMELLHTDLWPKAIPDHMIVQDEAAKKVRATAILTNFVTEPVAGKKFLDFGCDEAHCVDAARERGAEAIGYDVRPAVGVETDIEAVHRAAPFDIIMAYDVLDHIPYDQDRIEAIANIKKWLKPGGKAYVRCHPFTSRHGRHNYHKLNKAYAHLLIRHTDMEKYDPLPTVPILAPLWTYKQWFDNAGLGILSQQLTRVPMEPFFLALLPQLLERMSPNDFVKDFKTLDAILSIQFINYVLI